MSSQRIVSIFVCVLVKLRISAKRHHHNGRVIKHSLIHYIVAASRAPFLLKYFIYSIHSATPTNQKTPRLGSEFRVVLHFFKFQFNKSILSKVLQINRLTSAIYFIKSPSKLQKGRSKTRFQSRLFFNPYPSFQKEWNRILIKYPFAKSNCQIIAIRSSFF